MKILQQASSQLAEEEATSREKAKGGRAVAFNLGGRTGKGQRRQAVDSSDDEGGDGSESSEEEQDDLVGGPWEEEDDEEEGQEEDDLDMVEFRDGAVHSSSAMAR